MRSRLVVQLSVSGLIVAGACTSMTGGDPGMDARLGPKGVDASLIDTLQRDHAVFVQPRYLFLLPAPRGVSFASERTKFPDAVERRTLGRTQWVIVSERRDWADILVFAATPSVPKGPLHADSSLRRFAASNDSAMNLGRFELRGSRIRGEGDRTDYRSLVWDKQDKVYLRTRCVPSPEGRPKPVFVCIAARSLDTLAFDPEVRGLQFADRVPGFQLPANLKGLVKLDTIVAPQKPNY